MRRLIPATALLALGMTGCRDGVPPFNPDERVVTGDRYALTFGYGQDADPQWSPSGDTVLYHTTQFGGVPQVSGVVLAVPARGGAAVPVMADLQPPGGRPLVTPAWSPDGERVAYMDLMNVDAPRACSRTERLPDGAEALPSCVSIQPLLDSAVLRVRRIGDQHSIALDPAISVRFPGPDPVQIAAGDGPWYEKFFPFQSRHRTEHALLFRPSWAPDGERIAFSDGLSIRIWNVEAGTVEPVAGTDDGVSVAWSPDGEWLAFTALPREDSVTYQCACPLGPGNTEFAYRTVYGAGPGTLVIIRPDGSERLELGEGEDPAWSPDGSSIYVRRGDGIVRVPRSGGAATEVAGTERGRSPAVSPDGTRLAFSRRKPSNLTLDYDIWVVSTGQ
ncbi:MAG TPA: hypothetical protein VK933_02325 [Longimicrobiales bacterium]|nr:hypothetical protein [Longimicrobiales bacterium]